MSQDTDPKILDYKKEVAKIFEQARKELDDDQFEIFLTLVGREVDDQFDLLDGVHPDDDDDYGWEDDEEDEEDDYWEDDDDR